MGDGFARLTALGWVVEFPDPDERCRAVAQEYADAVHSGPSILVVSQTHREGGSVTTAIRRELRARGMLGAEERAVACLEPVPLTLAERGDPVMYAPGDVVEVHKGWVAVRRGSRLTVRDTGRGPGHGVERYW